MTDPLEATLDVSSFIEEGPNESTVLAAPGRFASGVDYSVRWSSTLLRNIKGGGYAFIVRYTGTPGRSKSLLKAEVVAAQALGLGVVSVFEDKAATATQGYSAGVRDAARAFGDLLALGAPPHTPCYFAVDTDVSGSAVVPYFQGLAKNYPVENIGIYAGLRVIRWIADRGLAAWFWQTRAWSKEGGVFVWDSRDHLRQFPLSSPFYVLGSCDLDWAMKTNYGQWGASAPAPQPKPDGPARRLLIYDPAKPMMTDWDAEAKKYPLINGLGQITWAQRQLIAIRIGVGPDGADGKFGKDSALGITTFQTNKHLVIDGKCGDETWTSLEHS